MGAVAKYSCMIVASWCTHVIFISMAIRSHSRFKQSCSIFVYLQVHFVTCAHRTYKHAHTHCRMPPLQNRASLIHELLAHPCISAAQLTHLSSCNHLLAG